MLNLFIQLTTEGYYQQQFTKSDKTLSIYFSNLHVCAQNSKQMGVSLSRPVSLPVLVKAKLERSD